MSEQDLNKELEELLDAELTEDEVKAMEKEISQLDEVEEVGEDKDSGGGKSDDKAKKAKPTNSAPSGDTPVELDAGDKVEHDGEQLEEARMTKAKMLEDLGKMIEGLGKMKATELKGIHERMKKIVNGHEEEEVEESKESAELKDLETAKKEIEEKIKKISVKEDVEALIKGEDDLSDEFKEKAATIFEAAVKSKVRDEIEQLETEYDEKLQEEVNKTLENSTEKVDAYLTYVVDEWMKQNEVGIEQKLKTEITENFITGLKGLFEEHNIVVPDEKYDILDAAAKQADEMEAKLNEQMEKNIELSQRVAELEKGEILVDVASDLTDTEVEKFVGLAENVEYEDNDDYRKKLETIKDSYFTRTVKNDEVEAAPIYDEQGDMSNSMAAYMKAISKDEKRAH